MSIRKSLRRWAAVVFGVAFGACSGVAGATAPHETLLASPVVWYSDAMFGSTTLSSNPFAKQSDWKAFLDRNWGEDNSYPMNNGETVASCHAAFVANNRGLNVVVEESGKKVEDAIGQGAFQFNLVACYAARKFVHAVPARVSYLGTFKMTPRDARHLPAALSLIISKERTDEIREATKLGKTLANVVEQSATFTREPNSSGTAPMVRVSGKGSIEDMTLLGRGDFNHDGIEDLLISVSSGVIGGTYTQQDLYVVTRLSPNAPMKVLKAYPDLGLGIPTFH